VNDFQASAQTGQGQDLHVPFDRLKKSAISDLRALADEGDVTFDIPKDAMYGHFFTLEEANAEVVTVAPVKKDSR
jgi:hypothetical protein